MNGYRAPSPSPLRFAVAAGGWVVAMALLLIGGIVRGTGQIALTAAAIVLLLLSVAYVVLQVWYLNRISRGDGASTTAPSSGSRRSR